MQMINRRGMRLSWQQGFIALFLIFMFGCVFGFFYEEIFYFIVDGYFSKRGFFYGPWLPVYGWGAVLMVLTLRPFKNHPAAVFFVSLVITGSLEYLTGLMLLKVWGIRLWDYGMEPLNFLNVQGFICLRSLLSFGVAGYFAIYILDPYVHHLCESGSQKVSHIVVDGLLLLLAADVVCSFIFRHPLQ